MKNAVVIWVRLCAYLNCAGWFLSAIRQLNAAGNAVALAVWVMAFLLVKRFGVISTPRCGKFCFQKILRRFERPFPLAWLVLAVMALLGAVLHAPTNYDGLAYRLPRVLHWLSADQWHWIHTTFPRVNNRACGIEWLSAPLIAIFKTDRLLFLINFVSFLFIPGLTFSVLSHLGVRHRVAWHWMWIAPSGYCFLLQAGSIANDSFATPFALAAIDFALRARISKRPMDLFTSTLAAALLTSAKTGNLTLLLPWAIAILPSLKIFLQRPIATAAVCIAAIFASFLPSAVLNYRYCRDWFGLSSEDLQTHGSIWLRTPANVVLLSELNLTPPVFPVAERWNHFVLKIIPPDLERHLQNTITEIAAYQFKAPDMQDEENAGLGFGVTVLLLASVIVVVLRGGSRFPVRFRSSGALWHAGIVVAPWISTFALLSQSEVYPIGRILAPFYILLLPLPLLFPEHGQLVRAVWWRMAALVVFFMAAGLLIISPARPLFPVGFVLKKIETLHTRSKLLTRIHDVYFVYENRNHAFQPVLDVLPPGEKILGYCAYDEPEATLWHPFGSRKIVHVCPGDTPADLKARGIEYILAENEMFGKWFPNLDVWLKTMNATVVRTIPLELRVAYGTTDWYLIKLN